MFSYNTRKQAEEEVEKRRFQSKTYTEPLDLDAPNVEIFLNDFYSKDIFEKGAEMKEILEKYSDSVGEHYKFLVPDQVSFDAFFTRYYYRCDVKNVMRDWQNEEKGRRIAVGRSRSSESLAEMASFLKNGGNAPPVVEGRRAGRRTAPTRQKSTDWFFKEKENISGSTAPPNREERNAEAFKLLSEARGADCGSIQIQ